MARAVAGHRRRRPRLAVLHRPAPRRPDARPHPLLADRPPLRGHRGEGEVGRDLLALPDPGLRRPRRRRSRSVPHSVGATLLATSRGLRLHPAADRRGAAGRPLLGRLDQRARWRTAPPPRRSTIRGGTTSGSASASRTRHGLPAAQPQRQPGPRQLDRRADRAGLLGLRDLPRRHPPALRPALRRPVGLRPGDLRLLRRLRRHLPADQELPARRARTTPRSRTSPASRRAR